MVELALGEALAPLGPEAIQVSRPILGSSKQTAVFAKNLKSREDTLTSSLTTWVEYWLDLYIPAPNSWLWSR